VNPYVGALERVASGPQCGGCHLAPRGLKPHLVGRLVMLRHIIEGRHRLSASLAIAVVALALPSPGADFPAKVVRIVDGDTIEIFHNGQPKRIRLAGVDAPERRQAFGSRARQFVGQQVFGKTVTVRSDSIDGYGRILGEVILADGRSLTRELVANGLAWHYKRFSADRDLARLEQEARAARRGLWSDRNPIPPWEFRQVGRGASERSDRFLGGRLLSVQ
jgi:micrococcal nuclease